MSSKDRSIFNDKDVVDSLTDLHNKYVVVPADKASNNIVFVWKTYHIDCLVKELGIKNNTGNPTYTPTSLSNDERFFPIISPWFHLLGYPLKMITLTYPLYIGYLNYTRVRTKKGILQDLLNAPRSSWPLYFLQL